MARIKEEELVRDIQSKGFKPIDLTAYQNLKSPIIISCENNHNLETNMDSFRKASFKCPICHGGEITITNAPPEKNGYRVLALDNASQNMGVSIFDDGKLVYYSLIRFRNGVFEDRLEKIFKTVQDIMIKTWTPDFIVFEDIQFQANYNTYKKLAMLLGVIVLAAKINKIPYTEIPAVTWRSHFQISGNRADAKKKAIDKVKLMYNISVTDDIAEAILIGRYSSDMLVNKMTFSKGF